MAKMNIYENFKQKISNWRKTKTKEEYSEGIIKETLPKVKRTLQNCLKFSARSLKQQNLTVSEVANFENRLIQTSLKEKTIKQNIYITNYKESEPKGSIIDYLNNLFSDVASQVASSKKSIDWVVINSHQLANLIHVCHNFFEEKFEKTLQAEPTLGKNISVIGCRTYCWRKDLETILTKHIRETSKQDIKLNYNYVVQLGDTVVAYNLKYR